MDRTECECGALFDSKYGCSAEEVNAADHWEGIARNRAEIIKTLTQGILECEGEGGCKAWKYTEEGKKHYEQQDKNASRS